MKTRVLIADDHSVVRQGLQTFLGLDPEIEIVGVANDGLEAVELTQQLKPDVLLLDLMMPKMDGFEVIEKLRQGQLSVRILVLTSVLETNAISRAIQAGANGYLLKNMQAEELRQTVKSVGSQSTMLSNEAAQLLASQSAPVASMPIENLTNRERVVLRMVAEGKANKEIAREIKLSEGTVKSHVSVILAKLGLQSRTQAAIYANHAGLMGHDETQ